MGESDSDVKNVLSTRKLASILKINVDELRAVSENASSYYRPFIKKLPKPREIDNPTGRLKIIQKAIDDELLKKIALPETVLGGVPGKSVKDNAVFHLGKPVVVTIDLKKCFPNTKGISVFKLFRNYFRYSTVNSLLLTKLTTFNDHVPQGSPCSSSLVNFCLLTLHEELQSFSKKCGYMCTAWVDDITISGEGAEKQISDVIRIIKRHKYSTRCKKIKVMRGSGRQEVTGITVNNLVSVPKKKISEIKKIIHDIRVKSLGMNSKEYIMLKGKMGFVGYVNPKQFNKLNKFLLKCGIKI
jgi:RNA-directed DNA polymerase